MKAIRFTRNNKVALLWWTLFFLIAAKLIFFLVTNKQFFLRTFDPQFYGDLYSKSQYVVGAASEGGIGDDGLYTFAGYYYLFQKGDVSAVNFEHPPLGKYLIGLSILLFRNENVINVIYFLVLLFITYKLGILILKSKTLSLFAVAILSGDPLFLDHLIRSLLDLPFTTFFILAVYFFLLSFKSTKLLYLSMLFWGAAFSTRFFPFMVFIYMYLLLITLIYMWHKLPVFIFSSFLIPAVYFISHTSFFIYHPSLIEFLRHKKWMLAWFSGATAIFANIWRNIFTGFYLDTTYKLVRNQHWSIFVPLVVVFSFIPVKKILSKKHLIFTTVFGLSVIYLVYATVLTDGNQKFIMPIYPLLCIMAVANLRRFYSIISSWKKWKLAFLRIS